jgi:hypothetical protein
MPRESGFSNRCGAMIESTADILPVSRGIDGKWSA